MREKLAEMSQKAASEIARGLSILGEYFIFNLNTDGIIGGDFFIENVH
jgi:hypothetical protein